MDLAEKNSSPINQVGVLFLWNLGGLVALPLKEGALCSALPRTDTMQSGLGFARKSLLNSGAKTDFRSSYRNFRGTAQTEKLVRLLRGYACSTPRLVSP